MDLSRIKIFQVSHVPMPLVNRSDCFPLIGVSDFGQSIIPDSKTLFNDNSGDNISDLNYLYSELTAHYWVWKNVSNIDYVGFFHHRRYFNIDKPYKNLHKVLLKGRELCIESFCTDNQALSAIKLLDCFDIITIRAEYNENALDIRWPSHHSMDLWFILKEILRTEYSFMRSERFFALNKRLVWYPMFITTWEQFNKICQLLFDILERIRRNVLQAPCEYTFSKRDLVYLAEPLLMLIIHYLKLTTYEAQVVVSEDDTVPTLRS